MIFVLSFFMGFVIVGVTILLYRSGRR